MAYAIMRAKKLKTAGSVGAALQHCFRERETLNADEDRTAQNVHLVATSTDQAMGLMRDRLPEKRRKDAVLAVEYVMTASPEWWETASEDQQKAFFDRSMQWLESKYGKENIVTASIHNDELTPHLSAFVVPVTLDGRLSAKEFIGNRTLMRQDQTTFAESLADLGLERGIEGSQATHQRVKTHYGAIKKADQQTLKISLTDIEPKVLRQGIFTKDIETPEMVVGRINENLTNQVKEMAEKASQSAHNEKRARDLRKAMAEREKALKTAQEAFKGLTKEQIAKVLDLASVLRKENEQSQEAKKAKMLDDYRAKRQKNKGLSR